jgi:hypothetical protein
MHLKIAACDQDVRYIFPRDKHDGVTILPNLLIGLPGYDRRRDQDSELPVTKAGDKPSDLFDPYAIRGTAIQPRSITFRFQGEFSVHRIIDKSQAIPSYSVPSTINNPASDLVDKDALILQLEDLGSKTLEQEREVLEMEIDGPQYPHFGFGVRRLLLLSVTVRPATFLTTESSIELGQDLLWIRALSGMGF